MLRNRRLIPNHFLLVPGVGCRAAVSKVARYGMNGRCGLRNSFSRHYLCRFDRRFAEAAAEIGPNKPPR
ncbi:MAG: hypothetical protein ACLTTP_04350 [Alistipes ihumii]